MADYQKMYYTLTDAVERALALLEQEGVNVEMLRQKAAAELIDGELQCEEIYIQTSEAFDIKNGERGCLTIL